jgi:TM2 domain-containing membrane protein YozV
MEAVMQNDVVKISCPNCTYSKDFPKDKVPTKSVNVSCPQCKQSFVFSPETTDTDFMFENTVPDNIIRNQYETKKAEQIPTKEARTMQQDKIEMFMAINSKYFSADKVFEIKSRLEKIDDSKIIMLQSLNYKDPTTMLIISIFAGSLGVDRFMLGQTGLGVLKLLTWGGCLIWWIIDIFTASRRTKDFNYQQFSQVTF